MNVLNLLALYLTMEIRRNMFGEAAKTCTVLFAALVSAILLTSVVCGETFNVVRYGAVGDGETDDTLAFTKAWKGTCNSPGEPTMVIPWGRSYLVNPVTFSGPCMSDHVNIKLLGTIVAPKSTRAWAGKDQSKWMIFSRVNGLNINGPGVVFGRGEQWWRISCKYHPREPGCNTLAPTAMSFIGCNAVSMSDVAFIDSPQVHVLFLGCTNVALGKLGIYAPGKSPNTDGIHIHASNGVRIHDSIIGTGDDCVSIGDHTWDINITDITCGPGHGVSIGSLGRDGNAVNVHDIRVRRVHFIGSTNGATIKTWQAGRGSVAKIHFSNLTFVNVAYPIIIDQFYCEVPGRCANTTGGVHVSDVHYTGATGTSKTKVAIKLACNNNIGCTNIYMDTVDITSAEDGRPVVSECNNAYGRTFRTVKPPSCLK